MTFAVRVVHIGLGVAAGVLIARALGPVGRGDYFFIVTFAGHIVQFGTVGLAQSVS
jgi:O-antigen/teichoic acid export membrane protein